MLHTSTSQVQSTNAKSSLSTQSSFSSLAESLKVKNCLSISINSQFLDMNFDLIKQCLTRLSQLENTIRQDRLDRDGFNKQIYQRLNFIQRDISNQNALIGQQEMKLKDIKQNVGQDFKRKLDELQEKSRNTHDIDRLVKQIQALNRFVSKEKFTQFSQKTGKDILDVNKIRDDLCKYVQDDNFKSFVNETSLNFSGVNNSISQVKGNTQNLGKQINQIDGKATKVSKDVAENNNMMKQINFNDMQQKLRKFKQETDTKLNEMILKLKKKVGANQLNDVQKNIIQKLDGFLLGNEKAKADRQQTKQALSFLQKRINQIYEIFNTNQQGQDIDPLFAVKKWMCASCTKDIGKYQGKLGQYKPWSVFPCRELDPEKTGGYGYLNYVDKMAYKKGFSVDDTGLDRLNKTFFEKNSRESSPKKMNTTRATNFMSNYGTAQKNPASLKDEYFKNGSGDKSEKGAKFFRVKNQIRKDSVNELQKQKVKEI